LGRFIRRGSLLRARGAGSARAQQLYLQRRGEFVTAPFFAAGCAAVTRQANGVKVGQKARGVQISGRANLAQVEQPENSSDAPECKMVSRGSGRNISASLFGPMSAELCAQHSRRARQIADGKSLLVPAYLSTDRTEIIDFNGARHAYPPRLRG